METAVGDDKVGRFFLHQPCYHFRCQTSSVNGTPHMSVSVADLLWLVSEEVGHAYGDVRSSGHGWRLTAEVVTWPGPRKNCQLRRRLLPPLRSSQTWLRSVLLDYYVIVRVKMCDDGSPCCSCVAVSTLSVPEVPCSQVDVLDGIWRKSLIAKVSIDFTYRKCKGL